MSLAVQVTFIDVDSQIKAVYIQRANSVMYPSNATGGKINWLTRCLDPE